MEMESILLEIVNFVVISLGVAALITFLVQKWWKLWWKR